MQKPAKPAKPKMLNPKIRKTPPHQLKKRGITVQARHQARLLEVGSYPKNTEVASRATPGMAVVPRNRGVQQDGAKECAEMRERCG